MISLSFVIEVASPSFLELFIGGRYVSSPQFVSHFGQHMLFQICFQFQNILDYSCVLSVKNARKKET